MKRRVNGFILMLAILASIRQASAQGTAFTFQGQFSDGASLATGLYDMTFALYDAASGGNLSGTLTNSATGVTNGLFTVMLDFGGGPFNGTPRWVEISARTNGSASFNLLGPRQPVSPGPYAIYAENAGAAAQANSLVSGGQNGMQLQYVSRHSSLPVSDFAGISVIGGFWGNTISNGVLGGTVAGGGYNATLESGHFLSMSFPNVVAGDFGTVGGGYSNVAGAESTIAGGAGNSAESYSVVGGGQGNTAQNFAAVGGGAGNLATGFVSVVPGGSNNLASGDYSFAAGDGALAQSDHSFVWSDGFDFESSINLFEAADNGPNTVTFYAQNGIYMITGFSDSQQGSLVGAVLGAGDSSWSSLCDRNAKKNFRPVDVAAVLDKLARIPIQQWNYKSQDDSDTPYIGPMAQDFKGAFYPGRDDKRISTLEFDGVELAAIQGLNQKVDERSASLESQLQQKETEIRDLKRQNDSLFERLRELEEKVNRVTTPK
jgi:hypothetical protein